MSPVSLSPAPARSPWPQRIVPLTILAIAGAAAGYYGFQGRLSTPPINALNKLNIVRDVRATVPRSVQPPPPSSLIDPTPADNPSVDLRTGPWFAAVTAASLSYPEAAAAVDPWSVQASDISPILFSASLFPYLAFLFFLSRPEVKLPRGALVGFAFLLVFVAATIPAGIFAKTQYGAILADVDWLHGTAESMLTVTNLLTVLGLRSVMPKDPVQPTGWQPPISNPFKKQYQDVLFFIFAIGAFFGVGQAIQGGLWLAEPKNALSIPTWVVHISSIVEYVAAMELVWKLSEVNALPQWRNLTYGMLPLLAGGLTACSFHVFYNAINLYPLVTLQALLTLIGNTTCAIGAWQVYEGAKEKATIEAFKATLSRQMAAEEGRGGGIAEPLKVISSALRPSTSPLRDTDTQWLVKLGATSFLGALAIKYGELSLGFPLHPEGGLPIALFLILAPTVATGYYFFRRSKQSPILLSER